MAKRVYLLFLTVLAPVLLIFLFLKAVLPSTDDDYYKESFLNHYGIYAVPIPVEIDFAGERVPLEEGDILERLDRELLVNTYWQSNTLLYIKRANRWFPVFEPILAANGIPDDFKYVALIESGLMNVVSPAGAAGFWQFLATTAREYGLEVNDFVDERYHVEKATQAACRYFLDGYRRFGNWTLAAAGYNMGNAGVSRQMGTQMQNCYHDLHLNEETSRYIFRILAVKHILENPARSGFHFREKDLYKPLQYRTITVDRPIANLAQFALDNGTNYKTLRLLNPWVRSNELPNRSGIRYELNFRSGNFSTHYHFSRLYEPGRTFKFNKHRDSFAQAEKPSGRVVQTHSIHSAKRRQANEAPAYLARLRVVLR